MSKNGITNEALSNFRSPVSNYAQNGRYNGSNPSVHMCANITMFFQRPELFPGTAATKRRTILDDATARLMQGADPCADLRSFFTSGDEKSMPSWPVLEAPPVCEPDWSTFGLGKRAKCEAMCSPLYMAFLHGDMELINLIVKHSRHALRPNQLYFVPVGTPGRPILGTILTAALVSPVTSVPLVAKARYAVLCHARPPGCSTGR